MSGWTDYSTRSINIRTGFAAQRHWSPKRANLSLISTGLGSLLIYTSLHMEDGAWNGGLGRSSGQDKRGPKPAILRTKRGV